MSMPSNSGPADSSGSKSERFLGLESRWFQICALALVVLALFYRISDYPICLHEWSSEHFTPFFISAYSPASIYKAQWTWDSILVKFPYHHSVITFILGAFGSNYIYFRLYSVTVLIFGVLISAALIRDDRHRGVWLAVLLFAIGSSWGAYLFRDELPTASTGASLNAIVFGLLYYYLHTPRLSSPRAAALGLCVGLALSFMTYVYVYFRVAPFLIGLAALTEPLLRLFWKGYRRPATIGVFRLALLTGLFCCIVPQFTSGSLSVNFREYFSGKGESLANSMVDSRDAREWMKVIGQIGENAFSVAQQLGGYAFTASLPSLQSLVLKPLRDTNTPGNLLISVVLIPFLLAGLLHTLLHVRRGRLEQLVLAVFFIGLFPSLFTLTGQPNARRLQMAIFPIFFFLLNGLDLSLRRLTPLSSSLCRRLKPGLVLAVAAFQLTLFFRFPYFPVEPKVTEIQSLAAFDEVLRMYDPDSGVMDVCIPLPELYDLTYAMLRRDTSRLRGKLIYWVDRWPYIQSEEIMSAAQPAYFLAPRNRNCRSYRSGVERRPLPLESEVMSLHERVP